MLILTLSKFKAIYSSPFLAAFWSLLLDLRGFSATVLNVFLEILAFNLAHRIQEQKLFILGNAATLLLHILVISDLLHPNTRKLRSASAGS